MKRQSAPDYASMTEQEIYCSARIRKKDSGIDVMMYALVKQHPADYGPPKIRVNMPNTFSSDDNFIVSVEQAPVVIGAAKCGDQILAAIFKWIALNRTALEKYWDDGYDSDADFYADLQSLCFLRKLGISPQS